jgi:hypothetical protein
MGGIDKVKTLCFMLITAFGIVWFAAIVYQTQFLKFIFSKFSNLLGYNNRSLG